MEEYRTHNCNELNEENIGSQVRLSGFVKTIRDLGALVFIDLRDHYGVTQLVLNNADIQEKFRNEVNIESTIMVDGTVIKRDEENYNPKISTGKVEVDVKEFKVLGKSKAVPNKSISNTIS